MPTSHGNQQRNAIRSSIKKLCMSTAIISAVLFSSNAFAGNLDGGSASVGAGSPSDWWVVYNGGHLDVTSGGSTADIQVLGPSTLTMDGGTVTPRSGYGGISFLGGSGTIENSTILGSVTLEGSLGGVNSIVTINNSTMAGVAAQGFGSQLTIRNSTMDSVFVNTNAAARIENSTVRFTGTPGMGGFAVQVNGGGGTLDLIDTDIIVDGDPNAAGLISYSGDTDRAVVTMSGGSISSSGYGAIVDTAATLKMERVKVASQNVGLDTWAAKAELTDTTIETTGDSAYGVYARNGGIVDLTGGEVSTAGAYASAILATGTSSNVRGTNTVISTAGTYANGVEATWGGKVELSGVSISTTGMYAAGISLTGPDTIITAKDSIIHTYGEESHGVAVHMGSLDLGNVAVTTDGMNAHGINAGYMSTVKLNGASVTTKEINAYGLLATQDGSSVTASDVLVATYGDNAMGAAAVQGGTLVIEGGEIKTAGYNANGVFVGYESARATLTDTRISTTGDSAHGILVQDGNEVTATQINVTTIGAGSHGVVAKGGSSVTGQDALVTAYGADSIGVSLADNSTAAFKHSTIIASYGPALKAESGVVGFDFSAGSYIAGGNGTLLTAAAVTTTTLTADGNSYLSGDMVAEADDAVIDASLTNGSQWYGAAKGVTRASVDGSSYWQMTGSSDVGSLTNDGTIEFDAADPYKTLTAGRLAMNDGTFILNTKLNAGGAASETDRIVVTGDATGTGSIVVRNNGGTGAFTGTGATDGIQVVSVGGASDAEFKLGSAAIVGIYDYQLKKADGQNWYLQTEGSDVVDPPVDPVDPVNPVDPVDPIDPIVDPVNPGPGPGNPGPGTGHVVDIVPGYNIALSAAQNHVLTSLDTFHERLGELRAEALNDGYHAWMRGIGKTGSYSPRSVTGYNGHGFDMTTAGVQIGADYSKSDVFVAGDKLTVGIFGEYANSSFDVRGRTADGSISSKGLGGYVTWQQKAPSGRKPGTGAYVDAVVKQDWLDFGVSARSVSGFDLQNGYKGKATTASIETGYGFDLGNNVVLQPQAQLTWSKVKADSFTDAYGIAVHGQEAESLIGRVGVRLEKTFYFGDAEEAVEAAPVPAQKQVKGQKGMKGKNAKAAPAVLSEAPKKKKFVKSVTTYADANVKHEFKGRNGLVASNTGIGNDMGGTRAEIGVGVVARVSENVSLFGRGSVEFGGSTNVAGKVSGGLKITW